MTSEPCGCPFCRALLAAAANAAKNREERKRRLTLVPKQKRVA